MRGSGSRRCGYRHVAAFHLSSRSSSAEYAPRLSWRSSTTSHCPPEAEEVYRQYNDGTTEALEKLVAAGLTPSSDIAVVGKLSRCLAAQSMARTVNGYAFTTDGLMHWPKFTKATRAQLPGVRHLLARDRADPGTFLLRTRTEAGADRRLERRPDRDPVAPPQRFGNG